MTTAEDLWAALEESPGDHELRAIYADFLEENGAKKVWVEHNRMLVELARAPSLERASLLYKDFHERTVYRRMYDRHTIACVEKWGVGDYLRMRSRSDGRWGLEGDELEGKWLSGWAWLAPQPLVGHYIVSADAYLGTITEGVQEYAIMLTPTPEFTLSRHFDRLDYAVGLHAYSLKPPRLLHEDIYPGSSEWTRRTWVVSVKEGGPDLFLVQRKPSWW